MTTGSSQTMVNSDAGDSEAIEQKITELNDFKDTFMRKVESVLAQMEDLVNEYESNEFGPGNTKGFLVAQENGLRKFMSIDKTSIENLLEGDLKHWQMKLKEIQSQ